MSVQRSNLSARWAALSGPDRLAAGLWTALALLLAGVATTALVRSGSRPAQPKGTRIAPLAIPRSASAANAAPLPETIPAVSAAGASVASPVAATRSSGGATPAPPAADDVPDAALLPPGATLVRRVNLTSAIVAYWQTAAAGGCAQSRIVVLGPAGGQWRTLWDTSASTNGAGPLIPPATLSGDRCFPQVGLFAVQPLDASAVPFVSVSLVTADGRQQVISQSLADPAGSRPVLTAVPGDAQLSLGDGIPAVLHLSQPLYAPDDAGLGPLQGRPIGREDELRSWQDGAFQPGAHTVTLNCLSGSVLGSAASNAGVAVAFRCADGSVAAVAVTPATRIAPGLLIGGLQPGDDLSVALPAGATPACQAICTALPAASEVGSQTAAARQAAPALSPRLPLAPTATAPPRVAEPPRAAAPVVSPPRPATAAPAPAAPVAPTAPAVTASPPPAGAAAPAAPTATNPGANTTVVATARPIPPQPSATAPSRPVPTQSR